MQDAQFSNYKKLKEHEYPLSRTYHFIFSGDKISLYLALFNVQKELKTYNINYIDFVRILDARLSAQIWLIQKIDTIENEIDKFVRSSDIFARDKEDDFILEQLYKYKEKGFKNHFNLTFFYHPSPYPNELVTNLSRIAVDIQKDFLIIFTSHL